VACLDEGQMIGADMNPSIAISRILAAVAQNLSVEKLVTQLGLDPAHLTYDAVLNRLLEIVLASINFADILALLGAIFFVVTLVVRTIIPLRIFSIFSNVFFVAYGALSGSAATFFLYLLSLPINVMRLRQMQSLVNKARISAQGDLSVDWLRPFMHPRKYRQGDVLFHKGELAEEMFLIVTGKLLVREIGVELPPGRILGELGFLNPKNQRMQTVECIEDSDVLTIGYKKLLELYFQNPQFGYYFLRLTTSRLMQNIAQLEGIIEANQAGGQAAPAAATPITPPRSSWRHRIRSGRRRIAYFSRG
jgi:CRP-like cAMP-binding protein